MSLKRKRTLEVESETESKSERAIASARRLSTAANRVSVDQKKHPLTSTSKFLKYGTDFVDIYVGPEKKHFKIYKDPLCNKIPYFEMMFNGQFKEAKEKTATLPEDDPDSFDILMEWVLSDTLRSLGHSRRAAWNPLKLWCLADKLCLEALQDQVMDAWRDFMREHCLALAFWDVKEIYAITPSNSSARQFANSMLRYQLAYYSSPDRSKFRLILRSNIAREVVEPFSSSDLTWFLATNREILQDYLESTLKSGAIKDPRRRTACLFHQHGSGPCSLSKK